VSEENLQSLRNAKVFDSIDSGIGDQAELYERITGKFQGIEFSPEFLDLREGPRIRERDGGIVKPLPIENSCCAAAVPPNIPRRSR
jgi:hypothetical protein